VPSAVSNKPAPAARAASIRPAADTSTDEPDLSFDGEERVTLEHIEIGKVLPSAQSPGAPAGTRDIELDKARAPVDTGYVDLTVANNTASTSSSGLSLAPLEPEAEPERPSMELDASDDLFNRPLAVDSRADAKPRVDAERLHGLPLLGELPRDALDMLVRRVENVEVAPGDRVISEGDIPDKVYIVVRGDLVATRGTPPRPLARIGEGSFFGEMALLDDTPRSATVTAVTDAELLALPRALVMDLGAKFPTVMASLMTSLRARLIATLTATSPLFALIPAKERRGIVDRFKLREIEPGTPIIREGQRADGLYVILTGRADVVARGLPIATLTTGDVAGEMSLLSHGVAEASVRARTRVTALTLSSSGLQEIIMIHPQVLEHLATLSEARRGELASRRSEEPLEGRNVRTL
jgi:CRP-like cAMP-binding protein